MEGRRQQFPPAWERIDDDMPLPSPGPITRLPPELWLAVLSHLETEHILPLRLVNRQLSTLALTPCLHRRIDLSSPHYLTPALRQILPHARHLAVHLSVVPMGWGAPAASQARPSSARGLPPLRCSSPHPATPLRVLLPLVSPHLRSLSLQHATILWPKLAAELARFTSLHTLDLKAAGVMSSTCALALPESLRHLDLSHNAITSLPHLPHLESLSLAGCFTLPAAEIARILAHLPDSVHTLDLSLLQQVQVAALMALRVVRDDGGRTALRCIKLEGIDHLTRADVRALQTHWAERRKGRLAAPPAPLQLHTPPPSPPSSVQWVSPDIVWIAPSSVPPTRWLAHATPRRLPPTAPTTPPDSAKRPHDDNHIHVVHTALLESDDEAGYRQFIGEVVGGTLGHGFSGAVPAFEV
ncbi:hypothetical protein Q8F55_004942 [Vanrija albida]|uniref:F-box domain-containing protein n=1 Tax=Vanrija albida TaxID=181172 RepID=A0ABR3Q082_9TREE